jgi:hypothetical protein
MLEILSLFHHTHHKDGEHKVHHCGGKHREVNSKLDYTIKHCSCGKHSIDKEIALGHVTNKFLEAKELDIKFLEKCPKGGWHIESGILIK